MHIDDGHKADCVFCRELAGSRETNFAKRYPELSSRIVGETESLVAFPCIGQLSPGHFLVIPKKHVPTMRDAASITTTFNAELAEMTAHVHMLLDADPQDSLYFEHGAECPAHGGCGIYHAHLHVVPHAGRIDLAMTDIDQLEVPHANIYSALSAVRPNGSYLVFGSYTKGFIGKDLASPLPSQTLRKLVAQQLSNSSWDWREAGREADLLNVVRKAVAA